MVEFREGVYGSPFARYMLNSMIVSFSVMAGQLLVASLSASRSHAWSFREDAIFHVHSHNDSTDQVIIIPQFILMRYMKWIDTCKGADPGVFEAFGAFILRQFSFSIPPPWKRLRSLTVLTFEDICSDCISCPNRPWQLWALDVHEMLE